MSDTKRVLNKKLSDELTAFLKDIFGLVEATNFEQHALWDRVQKYGRTDLVWNSRGLGYIPCVGWYDGHPVHISLLYAEINDKKILFWHATSVVVDYDLIAEWFSLHLPDVYRKSDATNAFNVFNATIKE